MKRGWVAFAFALVVSAASLDKSWAGTPPDPADWPTLQHDMQRTGFTATAAKPPYKIRWVWCNGEGIDRARTASLAVDKITSVLPALNTVRLAPHAQPMVRAGSAYIGSIEGEFFAIDIANGKTKWKAKASGSILHSATVANDAVYVGTLGGVDAFSLDGKKCWTFEDPDLVGFWSCPAVAEGLVLIGSLGGRFWGLEARTGKARWAYDVGSAIYHSPAVSENVVYFGAEDMRLYALEADTGALRWKSERVGGTSFWHGWPVIAAKEKTLFARTHGMGDRGEKAVGGAPDDYEKAQDALQSWAKAHPQNRTTFALKLEDGRERFVLEGGSHGFSYNIAPPPIVRLDGSVLMTHYSRHGTFQKRGKYSTWGDRSEPPIDWSLVDFQQGRFKALGAPDSAIHPAEVVRYDDFYQCTMGGDYLYAMQYSRPGGIGMSPIQKNIGPSFDYRLPSSTEGKSGTVGGYDWIGGVSWTLLPELILAHPYEGWFVVALENASNRGE